MSDNGRQGGWFRVSNEAIDRIREVGPLAFCVYAILCRHADADGYSFPSVSRMSEVCRTSDRSIQRSVKALVAVGMINVESRDHNGKTMSNLYRVPTLRGDMGVTPTGEMRGDMGVRGDTGVAGGVTLVSQEQDTVKKTKRRRTSRGDMGVTPTVCDLPPSLDTAEFRGAWDSWMRYRKQARKPLTPETAKRQLAKCAKLGADRAAAAIEVSIERGWQGIYEASDGNGQPKPASSEEWTPYA
jgi:hypothetical protein